LSELHSEATKSKLSKSNEVYFLHIIMKGAPFYMQNCSESTRKIVLFCILLFHLLGDNCKSIPVFFFVIFHKSFYTKFLNLHRYVKEIACTTRYESRFFHLFA
jgi:hypothetical protein